MLDFLLLYKAQLYFTKFVQHFIKLLMEKSHILLKKSKIDILYISKIFIFVYINNY